MAISNDGRGSAVDDQGKPTGAVWDIQAQNRANYSNMSRATLADAKRAQQARRQSADFIGGIARGQRQFYDANVAPIEGQVSDTVQGGLNPDYAGIRSDARSDISKSYLKVKDSMARRMARYGQTPTAADDQALQYQQDKAEVDNANRSADTARDTGIANAERYYQSGTGIPGVAAGEAASGGIGMGNYYDYQAMIQGNQIKDRMAGDQAGGHAIGSMFRDGGEVRIGEFTRPGKTIDLRMKYNDYRIEGGDKAWPDWLQENGYELGPDDLVRIPSGDSPSGVMRNEYATGGAVNLQSGDYIMPAAAVKFFGNDFFDELEAACEQVAPGAYARGGQVRRRIGRPAYADGGAVGDYTGPGSMFSSLASGLRAGFTDRDQRDLQDERLSGMKEDRLYQRGQRERETRVQALQDEATTFSTGLQRSLQSYIASGGTNYQPVVDFYNTNFPTANKLDVSPNDDGTMNLAIVKPDGTRQVSPKKLSTIASDPQKDDFGVLMYSLSNPKAYFENKIKQANEGNFKVSSSDGEFLKYNEKTGDTQLIESPGGSKKKNDRADQNEKMARSMAAESAGGTLDAMGRFTGMNGEQAKQANDNAALTMQIFRNNGNKEMNAAHQEAYATIRENRKRTELTGNIHGANTNSLLPSNFDAPTVAAQIKQFFPKGIDETSARNFMSKHGIVDQSEQDQVVSQISAQTASPAATAPGGLRIRPQPAAATGQPSAPQAVPASEQRRPGQVYQTPRGPMKWTGTGWLPAN